MGKFVKVAALGAAAFYGGGALMGAMGGSSSSIMMGAMNSAGMVGAGTSGSFLSGFGGSLLKYGLQAGATIMQGVSQSQQYKQQASIEKANATVREINRKKNLIRAMSMSNVRMGAGGIGTGGSQANLAMQDIAAADLDQNQDDIGTGLRTSGLEQNARGAVVGSLLTAGSDIGTSLLRAKRRG